MLLPLPTNPLGAPLEHSPGADAMIDAGPDADQGWMISFVDVFMLLLTVFVLLLALQWQQAAPQPPEQIKSATPLTPAPTHAEQASAQPRETPPLPDTELLWPDQHSAAALLAALHTDPTPPAHVIENRQPEPVLEDSLWRASHSSAALLAALQPVAEPEVVVAERGLEIPEAVRERVEVATTADSVNLIIKDEVLFDPASADLKPQAHRILDQIAHLLAGNDHPVSVEGHTDDRPIQTARYPSNWDLSVARATEVTRYLIERGIGAQRLRAVGYADTRPLIQGTSDENRARNRRVSLVVHLRPQADE